MLMISRVLVGLLLVPVVVLLGQGALIGLLQFLMLATGDGALEVVLTIGLSCWLGFIGYWGLAKATFARDLAKISPKFVKITFISGLVSLGIGNVVFQFHIEIISVSLMLVVLSIYQFCRWKKATKWERRFHPLSTDEAGAFGR